MHTRTHRSTVNRQQLPTPIGVAREPGGTGSRRLLLTAPDSGVLHYALVTNGATAPSADLLNAARSELAVWAEREVN
jgi:hypothetical protein